MKREELEKLGLSKEQTDAVLGMHHDEMTPLKDELEVEKKKTEEKDKTIGELKKDLEEFQGADVSGLKQKISDLKKDIETIEEEHRKELEERNFNDDLREAISDAGGINSRAITALLDLESLKVSKNRREDLTAALKELAQKKDSKMLFGEKDADIIEEGSIPGRVKKQSDTTDAEMRAVMGLPPMEEGGNE